MSWTPYKLVYRAMAPVHIGYHKLGFIQRTRYYILGRNLWGALTANLTRSLGSENYEGIRQQIKDNIRFTYLYPTLSEDGSSPLIPFFTKEGIKYGCGGQSYLAHEFECIFIHAHAQTALEPSSLTAEEGSLHETEYIAPVVEIDSEFKPVFFVGYIFLRNGSDIKPENGPALEKALESIWVGGERKYGFGQLRLESKKPAGKDHRLFGTFNFNCEKGAITIPNSNPIPAHLRIDDKLKAKLKGDIEPLVGLEYGIGEKGKVGFGQKVSKCELCWMPGSVITDGDSTFEIGSYGILKTLD